MAGLATARKITQMGVIPEVLPSFLDAPVKANAKLWVGGMAASDSTGYFVDPTAATGLFLAGVVQPKAGYPQVYDATGLNSGDLVARVQEGVIDFDIGGGGDALTVANRYQPVFCMDDHTVGATDGGATPRSLAGILMGIDGTQAAVLVSAGINAAILAAGRAVSAALKITTIAAAGAIDPTSDVVIATITGTTAYTLANGTKIGQRIRVIAASASGGTPNATITPATPLQFATVSAIGAVGDFVELMWTGAGWIPGPSNGVTWA